MKKIISVISSLLIAGTLAFGFSACGSNGTDSGDTFQENFYYTAVCENGRTVSYTLRSIGSVSDAEIVIPSEYRGKPVTAIGESAFFNSKYITGITIPDTVETIGKYAFNGCERLTRAELGNGVKTIEDGAFSYCVSLEKISIPSSVRVIGSDVFNECTSLKEAVMEEGVQRMGRSVFTGCYMLEEVIFPDSIIGVGEDADGDYSMTATFMNCTGLKHVKLPEKLEFIPQWFFAGCQSLETVEIGKSVKSVGYSAFYDISSMKNLVLPASLVSCEGYSFHRLYGLEKVFFEGTAEQWAAIEIRRTDSGTQPLRASAKSALDDMFGSNVTVYFYSKDKPTGQGNFWHYLQGAPAIW